VKHLWLRRGSGDSAVLFFSGWGTDAAHARRLLEASVGEGFRGDMLALYDYRSLSPEIDLRRELSPYGRIRLVAWSFGVWAARRVALPPIERAVAVNGTLFPVDAARGIDPGIFRATLEAYGEQGRRRFERRMCGTAEVLEHFSEAESSRTTEGQREELRLLGDSFSMPHPEPAWEYDLAVVGLRDAIFGADRQQAAWGGTPVRAEPGMPHYPFFHLRSIGEVTGWGE